MAVEVRGGEERCRLILYQNLFVGLGCYPEDDHIRIALTSDGVDRVRSRVAEEEERPATHLVDRIVVGPVLDGDVWHGQSKFVYVIDPSGPVSVVGHIPTVWGLRVRTEWGSHVRSWRAHPDLADACLVVRPPGVPVSAR